MASTSSSGTDGATANALVLGNSRRGGVAGALLGSVGLRCVHHATRPLVLVPPA